MKDTIRLAEEYNANVVLLGDESNQKICSNWVDLATLKSDRFQQFKEAYVHLSPNGYDYELFCFERYFLLESYMKMYDLKECIMLDSDACTFTNYSEHNFTDYDSAASWLYYKDTSKWMIVPHVVYWKKDSLTDFIDFLLEQYRNHSERLIEKRNGLIANHATYGISDMSLLYLWVTERCGSFLNLAKAQNEEVFDVLFNSRINCDGEDFKMIHGVKKVIFQKGIPYFETITGQLLKADVIHAQGERKKYIHIISKRRYHIALLYWCDFLDYINKNTKRGVRYIESHMGRRKKECSTD